MKLNTSFLKRCIALAVALVLLVSSSNLGTVLRAFAAEDESITVSDGKLVALNYELTKAEENLLRSGLLKGAVHTYTVPTSDKLVTIKLEDKLILAEDYEEWKPVVARLIVDNKTEETVEFVDGKAAFTYGGDAFTVEVDYELNYVVDEAAQKNMLNAAAMLQAAMKNLSDVKALEDGLKTVQDAMNVLETVVENPLAPVSEAFKNAVEALSVHMDRNGGNLALRVLNAGYVAGTKYAVEKAGEYKDSVTLTYVNLKTIKNDELLTNGLLEEYLAANNMKTEWSAFKGVLGDLLASLESINKANWDLVGTYLLREDLSDTEYAMLDTLVAAVTEKTEIAEIKETLNAAKTTIRKNQSLVSVNVSVVLNAVQGNTVVESGKKTTVVSLREGATKDAVIAAIEASKVVAEAKAEWKQYVEGCFDEKVEGLVDKLTKDINVTITFSPKYYDVEFSYEVGAVNLPYGYKLTLPVHADKELAYDYEIDGESYMQGEAYTVTGNAFVKQTEGPAYLTTTLYTAIAQSFGDKVAVAIMSAGALKGDEDIFYRAPVFDGLLELKDGKLNAQNYITANGNLWKPYSYSFKETIGLFNGNVADWAERQATVQYVLELDADPVKVANALNMLADVKAEYDGQYIGMERLKGYQSDVKTLTRTYMSALKGIIGDFVFVSNAAKNQELRDYFLRVISNIQTECMTDGSGYLNIFAMINEYADGGMIYYYKNSETVRAEVKTLSKHLVDLTADAEKQAALAKLLQDPGVDRPELVEKIEKLGTAMTEIAEQLAPVNDNIDLESKNLSKLLNALASGEMKLTDKGAVHILSESVTVQDESSRMASVEIIIDGVKVATINTDSVMRGEKLSKEMIAELRKQVEAIIAEELGSLRKYYSIVDGTKDLVVGTEMWDDLKVSYVCEAKNYTVKIEGVEDQTINVNNMAIELPRYDNGTDVITLMYIYMVDGEEKTSASYAFSLEQIDRLFKNGVYEITRFTRNESERKLHQFLTKVNDNTAGVSFRVENGIMIADVTLSAAGFEALAAGLLEGGYSYIGMNGKTFMTDHGDGLEISLQTVLDAILNDETFSNQTIINLGKNNGGKVLKTNLQLGLDEETLFEQNMPFVLNLNSVPSQLVSIANGLNAIKNNFSFKAVDGKLDIDLNLPEKLYEAYLTALLVAGEVDTSDMNAVDNEIAFRFVYDYVDFILGNEKITADTFQNTLEMLDGIAFDKIPNKDLTAYAKYLEAARDVYNNIDIVTSPEAPVTVTVSTTAKALNKIINGLGIDLSSVKLFLGMVRELNEKNEGIVLTATAEVELKNTAKDFEAVIFDMDAAIEGGKDLFGAYKNGAIKGAAVDLVKGKGLANAADYTGNLSNRLTTVTGPAAIYLLSDVEGDLVINSTTIIDLNGFTVKGDIVANGKVLIVDSTIDTDECGGVEGIVSGNAFIVAGNYEQNVSKFLMDGYKQVGTSVQNAMYTIEYNNGNFNLVLNSDFMDECDGLLPSLRALAADIAVDLALNLYFPASLAGVYGIGDNFNDILGLMDRADIGEIADLALALVDVEGISNIMNTLMADMLKFGAIADAIENETAMGGYTLTTMPWAVEFMHVYEEGVSDYLTVGIVAKDEAVKNTTVSIKLVGNNIKHVLSLLRELDRIIVDDETYITVDLKQPVRDGKFVNIAGSAAAHLSVDLTVDASYQAILAVAIAYGNPDKAAELVAAMEDEDALYAAMNQVTIRELIRAMGAMSRDVTFAEMAAAVGATVTDEAERLENLYHLIVCASGKVLAKIESLNVEGIINRGENAAEKILEKLELTTLQPVLDRAGNVIDRILAKVTLDSTLGALDQGDGSYILQYAYARSGDVEVRGYGVNYALESLEGMIKVKVFTPAGCLWGDANHDGEVNAMDATLVLQYSAGTLAAGQEFCTLRTDVNGDGEINAMDATLILQHSAGTITKFPVEG